MIDNLRITVLVENTVRAANLLGEHGLAFWIEADGHQILFDTGQGKVLQHNAKCLEIPLDATEMVLISHGHYDHTGGLKDLLDKVDQIDCYLHPAALEQKYHREKKSPNRSIGILDVDEHLLRKRTQKIIWTRLQTSLLDGIHLTGEIPRRNNFEDTGGPFYLDKYCIVPDPMLDDQALYIETAAGLVVLLGCAHAGVVNTLDYIAELTGRARVYAVLGGMHLAHATPTRLEATIATLKRYGVQKVGTAHCTGIRATSYLWSKLPGKCFECSAGSVFAIGNGTKNIA